MFWALWRVSAPNRQTYRSDRTLKSFNFGNFLKNKLQTFKKKILKMKFFNFKSIWKCYQSTLWCRPFILILYSHFIVFVVVVVVHEAKIRTNASGSH